MAYVYPHRKPEEQTELEDEELKAAVMEHDDKRSEEVDGSNIKVCWCLKIYNFSLLKKSDFTILIISNMIFHLGVYTVFGFTVVG